MHSKKSNIGMAAKAFLLTAIGLPMGVSAQGVIEEKADTIVVYPTQHLEEVVIVHQIPIVKAQLVVGRIKPVKVIGNAEQQCGKSGCFSQFLILGERVGPDTQAAG